MDKINLLIVDDHQIVRQGIVSIVESNDYFNILGEASNGKEALEIIDKLEQKPKVVLMDIHMPVMDGMICTEKIVKNYPDINVLVLTMIKQNAHIKKMLQVGAMGYILKTSNRDELFKAIAMVANNESYFSPSVSNEVMQQMMKIRKEKTKEIVLLTTREKEILELIVNDLSNKQIADKLNISVRTVESHKQNLLSKTGTSSVAGLVVFALKNNMVELEE